MALEPLDPERALELYMAEKEHELANSTLYSHRSRLGFFLDWCEKEGIGNLNDVTGRRLHEYRLWRRNTGELCKVTEKTQMDTLRVFIRWCESIDGVEQDLHVKVRSPDVTPEENSREVMLDGEQAEPMLEYVERYEYASRCHVALTLLWKTMLRVGAAHALDVDDYDREGQYLAVRHRPETGTPIKNKQRGERLVALSGQTCMVLDDWLRERRHDVTDEYGRRPLLTTTHGRASISVIRRHCYDYTRPCAYGADCPHDRDPDDCDAVPRDQASKCPSSRSPHAFRRGSITHHLQNDVPETTVGDRANVSPDVIEQHYDQRTEQEKMEQRREYLSNI